MLKEMESLYSLFLKIQNLIRFGKILEVDYEKNLVLIEFSDDCKLWLKSLYLNTGSSFFHFPHEKNEIVLVLSMDGDLSEGIVWGSLPKEKSRAGVSLKTEGQVRFISKKGFYLGNGKEDFFSLVIEALKTIAESKTPTLLGSQMSIDSFAKLPLIVSKLENLHAKGD